MPETDFGPFKEYHYWNHLFYPSDFPGPNNSQLDDRDERRAAFKQEVLFKGSSGYEDFFKGLIREKVFITGDITPAYSVLSSTHLALVRQRLVNAGFKPRVVFILRDPVKRNLSAMLMGQRRHSEAVGLSETSRITEEAFRDFYQSEWMQRRTRYDLTIQAIESVFQKNEYHFMIFEEMFNASAFASLWKFLDLKSEPPSEIPSRTTRADKTALSESAKAECREFFDPVYRYCAQRFPQVEALWGFGAKDADL